MPDAPDLRPGDEAGAHPTDAELAAHLDGTLDPTDDQRVARHLDGCAACVARLDAFETDPVLSQTSAAPPAWNENAMRRSVRRTLLRTALNAVGLLVVGAIVLTFVGQVVLQPLLVDRGGRVQQHVLAAHDIPVLTIPGAQIAQVVSNPGVVRRTTEVEVERAVGAGPVPLGWLTTRLGPRGVTMPHGGFVAPSSTALHDRDGSRFGNTDFGPTSFEPERLGEGTAVTVQLSWVDDLISQTEAQRLANGAEQLALSWVGFLVPGADTSNPWDWQLGYSACGVPPAFLVESSGRGIGGFGGSGFRQFDLEGRGVEHALAQVRRATANLAEGAWPEYATTTGDALSDLETTAAAFAEQDPEVASLVVTGPTDAVAELVREAAPSDASLLEVDFDRGAPLPCG